MRIRTSLGLATLHLGLLPLSHFENPKKLTAEAITVTVTPEEPKGYPGNPSTLATPLRQDIEKIRFEKNDDGTYSLLFPTAASGREIAPVDRVDLRAFVPRIPKIATGDSTWALYALIQREFNRHETKYERERSTVRLANNCLVQGMWEILVDRVEPTGSKCEFHGWFSFPKDEYTRLFEEQNSLRYSDYRKSLEEYPHLDGMAAPLEKLRTVVEESPSFVPTVDRDGAPLLLPEQKRKANLVLSPRVAAYRDFHDPKNQPVKTAIFSEPGYYNINASVSFDLGFLAAPRAAILRSVRTTVGGVALDEIEIAFENGYRLLVADEDLRRLPSRTGPPAADKDVLRVTFGVSTPEIYATSPDRVTEFKAPRESYGFILGPDGKHVDNHRAGLDRVFFWREAEVLHVLVIGYERIAAIAHYTVPFQGGSVR